MAKRKSEPNVFLNVREILEIQAMLDGANVTDERLYRHAKAVRMRTRLRDKLDGAIATLRVQT